MADSRIAAAVVLLLMAEQYSIAADGFINSSFETNGSIGDLRVTAPEGWDVNVPKDKFSGRIVSGWRTDGQYGLLLRANWFVKFSGGEMATVSQKLVLDEVEKIVFDLRLTTVNGSKWTPDVCTPTVLIDDEVAWQSDFDPDDIRGEHLDQVCQVARKYRDGRPHQVSLGLKMNAAGMWSETYESYWDAVEIVPLSNGGTLPGDFNYDGYVEYADLAMLAAMWMAEAPSENEYNLSAIDDEDSVGVVNFFDLAVFGGNWLAGGSLQEQGIGS